jgi:carbon-monoxide dehydrogenase small subunit
MRVELTINGDLYAREVEPDLTLLAFLRDVLGLTGTKWGCLTGDCGACTVLAEGKPVVSCLQLSCQVQGQRITTIEGVETEDGLDEVQAAFVSNGAAQCGFCTPGMIMSVEALLRSNPSPEEGEIREALAGNLCRCTGYNKIVDAVLQAAAERRSATAGSAAVGS